jgi:DNA-binding response OmpR family regulator
MADSSERGPSLKRDHPTRVLIVEDEALEAYLLSNFFTLEGFEVCEMASRGTEAVRIAAQSKPDIIIMDNGLAGSIDGLETARQIREFSSAPILFLTGYLNDDMKTRIRHMSPADHLVKPARVSEVLDVVNKLLSH